MAHTTTNQTLPADVQKEYELVRDLPGGPRFDYPQLPGVGTVDFSTLTLERAANLVAHKFPFLRRKESAPAAAPPKAIKASEA